MSIEFRCTQCNKLLATPAGTQGQQAKCPQCGTILLIPDPASPAAPEPGHPFEAPPPRDPDFASSPPPPVSPTGPAASEANPYSAPLAHTEQAPLPRGYNPTRIDLGETFSKTWEIYKTNLGACIVGVLIWLVSSIFVSGVVQALLIPIGANLDGAAFFTFWLVQQVVGQAIGAFFYLGMILFMLRIARGGSAEFGLLFGGGPFFLYGVVIQIIIALATFAGFLLLIIPGVILALMFSQAMFVLIDQRADIGTSLRLSIEAMKGNKLTVFAIWVVGGLLSVLITLCTCGIGFFFVTPFMLLLTAVVYLGVTGQATAADVTPHDYGTERGFDAPGMQPT